MDTETKQEFENLARMMQNGFLDLKEDIQALDSKVSRIDMRTANQADSLYVDMRQLDKRVEKVETKLGIVPSTPKPATL